MIRKLFKWLAYTVVLMILLIAGVLATAYWNRDKLLNKLTAELNKGINGTFHISKIDFTFLHNFPNFSITLQGVNLRDSQYAKYQQQILSARKIFVDVAFYPLLKKEFVINSIFLDDADIFIFKALNGDTNTDIFKKPADSVGDSIRTKHTSALLNLQQTGFNNVSVVFVDSARKKVMNFQFVETEHTLVPWDSGYNITIAGAMHFDSLMFNPQGGSFLKNKDASVNLFLQLNTLTNTLAVLPSTFICNKNEIALTGGFEIKKEGKYDLRFKGADIDPTVTQEILNEKIRKSLSRFKCEAAVTVDVNVRGRSIPGYIPNVDVAFETKNADFHYAALDFSSLTLKGSFTNHVDDSRKNDNRNSKVIISYFKGEMEKIPVKGKVTFIQLQDPVINLSFTSKISYKDVNAHLDNDRLVLDKGNFLSEVNYQGKLSEYLDPTRTAYEGKLKGSIQAKDASLYYKPKKIRLDQIQLTGSFNEKLFTVDKLTLNVNGSTIAISGKMQDFIPFFIQPKNKASVALKVSSPNFDLTTLASPRGTEKKTRQQNKKDRKRMTEMLDMVYDRLEFDVDLKVSQLRFRKFAASNFTGRVRLNNQLLQANPISMDVAGGNMQLNFSLKNVFSPVSPMVVKAQITKANIKELFLNFNNFNQKTIHADNLRGRISANVIFSANVDETYKLITPSMRGTLDCRISDGGLVNFEPMENMSNFLFKKRDFSDVEFAELNSNFSISGTDMDISRMEIQSSVLSLFLEGRYSFTDSTSLSVQIPLSNLKKRHKDFKPKNIGTHAKAGPSVFLHVYREKDINSKIKIDYDPFKKWASN